MPGQRTTPRQRLVDEDGFTLVCSRRRKSQAASEASSAPEFRRYLLAGQEGDSPFQAVRRLEQAYPDLRVRVTERRGEVFLDPKNEEAAFCLSRVCREGTTFGVRLQEVGVKSRGVVLRYPLNHSLEPLQQHPCVTFAKRCFKRTGHGRTEATRQVEVELRGPLPSSLDLGYWGCYSVRRFTPEPLRCFKCQGFGHVQKHCERRELCGVCSQRHPTSECIRALKEGLKPEACCPNCGGRHHVWAPHCPERLRRLPPGMRGKVRVSQPVSVSPAVPRTRTPTRPVSPPPAPPSVPAAKGRRKRRRRRRRVRAAPKPAVPSPAVTESASQATARTADAATETEKIYIDWCPCDEQILAKDLNKVLSFIPHEFEKAKEMVAMQLLRIAQLRAVCEYGIGPDCTGNCYPDKEEDTDDEKEEVNVEDA